MDGLRKADFFSAGAKREHEFKRRPLGSRGTRRYLPGIPECRGTCVPGERAAIRHFAQDRSGAGLAISDAAHGRCGGVAAQDSLRPRSFLRNPQPQTSETDRSHRVIWCEPKLIPLSPPPGCVAPHPKTPARSQGSFEHSFPACPPYSLPSGNELVQDEREDFEHPRWYHAVAWVVGFLAYCCYALIRRRVSVIARAFTREQGSSNVGIHPTIRAEHPD